MGLVKSFSCFDSVAMWITTDMSGKPDFCGIAAVICANHCFGLMNRAASNLAEASDGELLTRHLAEDKVTDNKFLFLHARTINLQLRYNAPQIGMRFSEVGDLAQDILLPLPKDDHRRLRGCDGCSKLSNWRAGWAHAMCWHESCI